MGITTIYKCDRCEHEQSTAEQMWSIEVGIKSVDSPSSRLQCRQEALWCRKCVEIVHLLKIPKHAPQRALPPKPTLEALVREIVEDAVNG